MKKIITAMADKYLNEKLKDEKFNVIGKDIQYIEGVFEQLEVQKDINVIIISTKLIKENKYKEIINKINLINKKIKIIIIIENKNENIELIKFLINKKIKYYFNLNNKKINYLFKYLKIKRIKINKNFKIKEYKKANKRNSKIITIVGTQGVGKTVFIGIFSKIKNKKILIIDFDKDNNSLHTLYGVNCYGLKIKKEKNNKKAKYKTKNNNINIKINYYIDLLIYFNLKNNKEKIKKIINYYQSKYDYILIDIGFYIKNNNIKSTLKNSDNIIFITEGNLLQLKKSKQLLDFYLNDWDVKKEKINILLNKKNKNTISTEIIKNIFCEFNFLGEIKFNNNYDSLINNHLKNLILNPKIIKDYKKIINKI